MIGTAAYMSPEQARGLTVDKRTDIWAFGCVLFEMLSGRSPFAGQTSSDTIAATLEREPPWSSLPPTLPERIRELLGVASKRIRGSGFVTSATRSIELGGRHVVDSGASHRRGYLIAVAIAATIVAVAATLRFLPLIRWLQPGNAPESREVIDNISLESPHIAFSPDGASLVIEPRFDRPELLIVRKVNSTEQRTLPGTEGALFPFWSPDGRSIGFFAERKLKRIDLIGETVQEIAEAPIGRGGAWTADGSILFAPTPTSALYRVPASGGQPVALTTLGSGPERSSRPGDSAGRASLYLLRARIEHEPRCVGRQHRWLRAAPAAGRGRGCRLRVVGTFALRSGEPTVRAAIRPGPGHARVVSPSRLPITSRSIGASASRRWPHRRPAPSPMPVPPRCGSSLRGSIDTGADVGRVGTADASPVTNPAMSPDGRSLAFARLMDGNWDIWLMEMARGVMTRLTSEPNLDFFPVWADDSHIIYQSVRGVEADLYRLMIGAKGELLMKTPGGKVPMDVSRDGRLLLFGSATSETDNDIWLMPLDGSGPPQPLVATRFVEGGAQFSPDGRWFAYSSNDTGRFEIYVRPLSGSGPSAPVSTAGGNVARWSHSGNELFYVAPDGKLMSVKLSGFTAKQLTIGAPVAMFTMPIDPAGFGPRSPFVVSTDDQRFLMPIAIDRPTPATLILIRNWRAPS